MQVKQLPLGDLSQLLKGSESSREESPQRGLRKAAGEMILDGGRLGVGG
jgi:hypothetical protein